MKKVFACLALTVLTACSSQLPKTATESAAMMLPLVIPKSELERVLEQRQITLAEAKQLAVAYEIKAPEGVLKALEDLDHLNYAFCGGVYWDGEMEQASLMSLVGVTEKWIPIDGTVTRVLHFKLHQ